MTAQHRLRLRLTLAASLLGAVVAGWMTYSLWFADRLPGSVPARQWNLPAPQQRDAAAALMQLTLADLEGRPQAFAQWRGKLLVVNFWASWCTPCVEEMPVFSRLHERYAGQGVQFVGIGIDTLANMQKFVQGRPVSYPLLVATPSISETPGLALKGLPYTLLIGRDGKPAADHLGRLEEAVLEPLLQRLLAD